ncbi:MAG: protein translocase subunit SecF [Spirochaetaceae bacterium]|nr:protein translocase subunit SecF [Spirochaetaceae bacterium]
MNEKIIYFSKLRIPTVILAILMLLAGVGGTIYHGGFNLGIDFSSGLSMRVQIAESVLEVSYAGEDRATINVRDNALQITIIRAGGLEREENIFALADYPSISSLASALSAIEGIVAEETGNTQVPASLILGLNHATDLTESVVVLNRVNTSPDRFVNISDVRNTLSELGSIKIQTVGRAINQEFIIIMQNRYGAEGFNVTATAQLMETLGNRYGASNLIVRQIDYVGPQFSEALGGHAMMLVTLTLIFILVYIWFRFKLPYAISSVASLVYVAVFMVGFVGLFQLEVSTTTIAAILTVVGYALNDSIVIFDRIRENQMLLKEKNFVKIVDISVTKSLGRTIITSSSTILAVAAIFIFATGAIRLFALNAMVGIAIGTFSSIFIASPILILLIKWATKRGKLGDAEKKSDDKPKLPPGTEAKQLPAESEPAEDAGESNEVKPQLAPQPAAAQQGARWQPKRKRKR